MRLLGSGKLAVVALASFSTLSRASAEPIVSTEPATTCGSLTTVTTSVNSGVPPLVCVACADVPDNINSISSAISSASAAVLALQTYLVSAADISGLRSALTSAQSAVGAVAGLPVVACLTSVQAAALQTVLLALLDAYSAQLAVLIEYGSIGYYQSVVGPSAVTLVNGLNPLYNSIITSFDQAYKASGGCFDCGILRTLNSEIDTINGQISSVNTQYGSTGSSLAKFTACDALAITSSVPGNCPASSAPASSDPVSSNPVVSGCEPVTSTITFVRRGLLFRRTTKIAATCPSTAPASSAPASSAPASSAPASSAPVSSAPASSAPASSAPASSAPASSAPASSAPVSSTPASSLPASSAPASSAPASSAPASSAPASSAPASSAPSAPNGCVTIPVTGVFRRVALQISCPVSSAPASSAPASSALASSSVVTSTTLPAACPTPSTISTSIATGPALPSCTVCAAAPTDISALVGQLNVAWVGLSNLGNLFTSPATAVSNAASIRTVIGDIESYLSNSAAIAPYACLTGAQVSNLQPYVRLALQYYATMIQAITSLGGDQSVTNVLGNDITGFVSTINPLLNTVITNVDSAFKASAGCFDCTLVAALNALVDTSNAAIASYNAEYNAQAPALIKFTACVLVTTTTLIGPCPTTSAPASSAPASSAPVSSAPVSSAPVSSTPVSSAPASSTPASSAPISSTPASSNVCVSVSSFTASVNSGTPVLPCGQCTNDPTSIQDVVTGLASIQAAATSIVSVLDNSQFGSLLPLLQNTEASLSILAYPAALACLTPDQATTIQAGLLAFLQVYSTVVQRVTALANNQVAIAQVDYFLKALVNTYVPYIATIITKFDSAYQGSAGCFDCGILRALNAQIGNLNQLIPPFNSAYSLQTPLLPEFAACDAVVFPTTVPGSCGPSSAPASSAPASSAPVTDCEPTITVVTEVGRGLLFRRTVTVPGICPSSVVPGSSAPASSTPVSSAPGCEPTITTIEYKKRGVLFRRTLELPGVCPSSAPASSTPASSVPISSAPASSAPASSAPASSSGPTACDSVSSFTSSVYSGTPSLVCIQCANVPNNIDDIVTALNTGKSGITNLGNLLRSSDVLQNINGISQAITSFENVLGTLAGLPVLACLTSVQATTLQTALLAFFQTYPDILQLLVGFSGNAVLRDPLGTTFTALVTTVNPLVNSIIANFDAAYKNSGGCFDCGILRALNSQIDFNNMLISAFNNAYDTQAPTFTKFTACDAVVFSTTVPGSCPVSSVPASSTPASSEPISSVPESSEPVSSATPSSTPASSAPGCEPTITTIVYKKRGVLFRRTLELPGVCPSSAPVSSAPASSVPASSAPASSAPASSAPASSAPASSSGPTTCESISSFTSSVSSGTPSVACAQCTEVAAGLDNYVGALVAIQGSATSLVGTLRTTPLVPQLSDITGSTNYIAGIFGVLSQFPTLSCLTPDRAIAVQQNLAGFLSTYTTILSEFGDVNSDTLTKSVLGGTFTTLATSVSGSLNTVIANFDSAFKGSVGCFDCSLITTINVAIDAVNANIVIFNRLYNANAAALVKFTACDALVFSTTVPCALSSTPASSAPASSAPASSAPVSSVPSSTPVSSAPGCEPTITIIEYKKLGVLFRRTVELPGVCSSSAPASSTPASSAPVSSVPASSAPASSAPASSSGPTACNSVSSFTSSVYSGTPSLVCIQCANVPNNIDDIVTALNTGKSGITNLGNLLRSSDVLQNTNGISQAITSFENVLGTLAGLPVLACLTSVQATTLQTALLAFFQTYPDILQLLVGFSGNAVLRDPLGTTFTALVTTVNPLVNSIIANFDAAYKNSGGCFDCGILRALNSQIDFNNMLISAFNNAYDTQAPTFTKFTACDAVVFSTTVPGSCPVSSVPASSTPASSEPISSVPASSEPVSSATPSSTPASSAPGCEPTITTIVYKKRGVLFRRTLELPGVCPSSAPVSSVPVSSTPASSTPASSAPVSSVPASSAPASSAPACEPSITTIVYDRRGMLFRRTIELPGVCSSSAPASSAPASSTPASSAPASSAPASSVPVSSGPDSSVPGSSVPVSSVPSSSAPASSTPTSSPPSSSAPSSSAGGSSATNSSAVASSAPVSSRSNSSIAASSVSSSTIVGSSALPCSSTSQSSASGVPASSAENSSAPASTPTSQASSSVAQSVLPAKSSPQSVSTSPCPSVTTSPIVGPVSSSNGNPAPGTEITSTIINTVINTVPCPSESGTPSGSGSGKGSGGTGSSTGGSSSGSGSGSSGSGSSGSSSSSNGGSSNGGSGSSGQGSAPGSSSGSSGFSGSGSSSSGGSSSGSSSGSSGASNGSGNGGNGNGSPGGSSLPAQANSAPSLSISAATVLIPLLLLL